MVINGKHPSTWFCLKDLTRMSPKQKMKTKEYGKVFNFTDNQRNMYEIQAFILIQLVKILSITITNIGKSLAEWILSGVSSE